MVKLASARESRMYGPWRSRKQAEYVNAGLYLFAAVVLLCGFASQLSREPKSGLVLLLIALGLIMVVNLHDLAAHLSGIDCRLPLMEYDVQLALVEFAVPFVQTLGSILLFLAVLFLFIQVDATTAEILAIAKACEVLGSRLDMARRSIIIASDCKTAVDWVKNRGLGGDRHAQNIQFICDFLDLFGLASVVFCRHVSNQFADNLAKKGAAGGEAEKGYGFYKLEKHALNMLIVGPILWVVGSIHNSCQIYERADGHVQILQQSVHMPFLMGSLLLLVGAIFNSHEQAGTLHHGIELLGRSWVWFGIAGSLLFLIGGLTNVVKVFKMQQVDGLRLEKLRGGAQERLIQEREGCVPLIIEEQRRRKRPPPPAAASVLVEEQPIIGPIPTPYKDVLVGQT
ncbi:hypothetical protein LWI29_011730 [Acer saccharum]|uniref:RNase H type-1 domain-containing protein n=1 Tax=Acer saccharum TaxID=4024 RepID=A0AA39SMH5_ACESA|nr:hypothetical protein LWI29_011730 [Acer saccharum]